MSLSRACQFFRLRGLARAICSCSLFPREVLKRRLLKLGMETLEPRLALSTTPLITEFLASNNSTLADGDGNFSDWIELHNPTAAAIDLTDWHLTDQAASLDKWTFPSLPQTLLDPGEYLVVFASGQPTETYVDSGGNLHTNFSLNASGEYLALSDPSDSIVQEFAPQFPAQNQDASFGLEMSSSSQSLVSETSTLSYLVPGSGVLGTTWTEAAFDDNAWATGTAGIGYENNPGNAVNYSSLLDTTVPSGTTSVYTRFEFNIGNPSDFSSLTLRMMYDDGFVAYLNGEFLDSRSAPGSPQWNSIASGGRSDSVVVEDFVEFDISDHINDLLPGDNVLAIHSLNVNDSSDMLMIAELEGTVGGIVEPIEVGFFSSPTPGSANSEAFDGFVDDTTFNHDRGFYTSAFDLHITSATSGAMVVYTTDGSMPEVDENLNIVNGTEFTNGLTIAATTTVRAAAFKLGYQPTNVDTQTYIFLEDVLTQSPTGIAPPGFPNDSVNGQQFDYGMDPNVVNDPIWGPQLTNALKDIPTISLVTDTDNLFDSGSGIYVNAGGRGKAWERPTSIELINGDGTTGFQTDAGLRIRGGFSRGDFNPKHSFRLFFRGEYGDAKLNFPLFGENGADEFDAFDLRTAQNYAWSNDTFNNENHNTFLRDIFARDLQGWMGRAHTRSEYYHLYLNGVYWGMYQSEERPEADYASTYFGGTDEDWDAVKASGARIEATDGDLSAWGTLSALVNAGFTTDAAYFTIQGLNTDGSENPALEKHIDVDNLIDFMIGVNFTANRDMPLSLSSSAPNNFWAIRPHDGSHGWRWIAHDNEHSMGAQDHNVNHNGTDDISVGTTTSDLNPRYIHQQLTEHEEYRVRFADRVQALFFNNGPLTTANVQAQLDYRSAQIEQAIIAESARWGDQHNEPPKTKNTWQSEVNWLRNTFLVQRGDIVLQQFHSQDWLPDTDAPSFNQHGGQVSSGFDLTISAPAGTIYYTLDGSDPREIGGAISSTAMQYTGTPIDIVAGTTVRTRALSGGDWSALNEADFIVAPPADAASLRITELNYNPHDANQNGVTTELEVDNDEFEFVELRNIGTEPIELSGVQFVEVPDGADNEGIEFTFDQRTLAADEFILVVKNQLAFESRYGEDLNIAGEYSGRLSNGGEQITLRNASGADIQSFEYDDMGDWPGKPTGWAVRWK